MTNPERLPSLRHRVGLHVGVVLAALATTALPTAADWPIFPPPNTPLCDPSLPADFAYRGDPTAGRGLYADGSNSPSGDALEVLEIRSAEIEPIDGVIGLAAIGLSNSHQAFGAFERDVLFRGGNVRVATVNLANAGSDIRIMAGQDDGDPFPFCENWNAVHPDEVALGQICEVRHDAFYRTVERRLEAYGVSSDQIQVLWVMNSVDKPDADLNADDDCSDGLCWRNEIDELKAGLEKIIATKLVERFPNLKVIYLSSRDYGGYQQRGQVVLTGNPEPFSYDTAFAIKGVLETHDQLIVDAGGAQSYIGPAVAWGPYIWADGDLARNCPLPYEPAGGLRWQLVDYQSDGFHPSPAGETKIAGILAQALAEDPLSSQWFFEPGAGERFVIDASADTATNGVLVAPLAPALPLLPRVATYAQFPLDALPPDATIVSARLMLRLADLDESRLLDVFQVSSEWDESSTPAELLGLPTLALVYSHPVSPTTVADRDGSIGIDVRAAVEDGLALGEPLSFRLSARNPFPAGYRTRDYFHPDRPFDDPPFLVIVTE